MTESDLWKTHALSSKLCNNGMCVAPASPIRQVPDDILCEIFTQSLPSDAMATFDPLESPILLTHICQRWRVLAINFPLLWKRLELVSTQRDDESLTACRGEKLTLWLQRCKGIKIDFQFIY